MNRSLAGFQEREHTADWELLVWAPDLASLFKQAALGMYQLMGAHLQGAPRIWRDLDLGAADGETLLVIFLSELLYFGEEGGLGFDRFDFTVEALRLRGRIEGAAIESQEKEIKAVTFHNLNLRRTPDGYAVNIVFDV